MSKMHVGIFGPGLSGKTTLAKALSRSYFAAGIRSLVLDINGEDWGPGATVFRDEARFWETVWSNERHAIFCDEAAETIARDRDLVSVFTRLRHNGHKLIVMGHSAGDLLPVMRRQISTLYLFRQDVDACKVWSRLFSEPGIMGAMELNQYEFIHAELWGPRGKRCFKKILEIKA